MGEKDLKKKIKDSVYEAYEGLLPNPILNETVNYWFNLIEALLKEAEREGHINELEFLIDIALFKDLADQLKMRLEKFKQ